MGKGRNAEGEREWGRDKRQCFCQTASICLTQDVRFFRTKAIVRALTWPKHVFRRRAFRLLLGGRWTAISKPGYEIALVALRTAEVFARLWTFSKHTSSEEEALFDGCLTRALLLTLYRNGRIQHFANKYNIKNRGDARNFFLVPMILKFGTQSGVRYARPSNQRPAPVLTTTTYAFPCRSLLVVVIVVSFVVVA